MKNKFSTRLSLENDKFRECLQADYGSQKKLTNFLFDRLRAALSDEGKKLSFFGYISTAVSHNYGDVYFTSELSEDNKKFIDAIVPRGQKAKTYNYLLDCLREAIEGFKGRPEELIANVTVLGIDAGFEILPPHMR